MTNEEKIKEHLENFPERQRNYAQKSDIERIEKKMEVGLKHPLAAKETLERLEENTRITCETKLALEEHITSAEEWKSSTFKQLNELMPIVREKLLPAYQKEMDKETARKILREDVDSFGFWLKFYLIVAAVIGSVFTAIKLYVK